MIRALRFAAVAALPLLVAPACVVSDNGGDVVEDALIEWTIDGDVGAALCDDYGVDTWAVDIVGPDEVHLDVDCPTTDWTTGDQLYGSGALLVGTYTVTVQAIDELADTVVTEDSGELIIDDLDNIDENILSFDFPGDDF